MDTSREKPNPRLAHLSVSLCFLATTWSRIKLTIYKVYHSGSTMAIEKREGFGDGRGI